MAVPYEFDEDGTVVAIGFPRYIFRFLRDDENLLATLTAPYLWFSDLYSFNDPLELSSRIVDDPPVEDMRWYLDNYGHSFGDEFWAAALASAEIQQILRATFAKSMEALFAMKLREVSVCCCSDRAEIPLMWGHYADGHRGICLVLNTAQVLSEEIGIQAVRYLEDVVTWNHPAERRQHGPSSRFDLRFDQAVLATKSVHWSYEREHRLIAHRRGRIDIAPEAIAGVIIGARTPDDRAEAIAEAIRDRYRGAPIVPIVRAGFDGRSGDLWPTGFDTMLVGGSATVRRLPPSTDVGGALGG